MAEERTEAQRTRGRADENLIAILTRPRTGDLSRSLVPDRVGRPGDADAREDGEQVALWTAVFRARQLTSVALAATAAFMTSVGPHRLWVAAGLLFFVLPYNVLLERRMRRTGDLSPSILLADVTLCALFPLVVPEVWVPALLLALSGLGVGSVALGHAVAAKAALLGTVCFATVAVVATPVAGERGAATFAIAAASIVFTIGRVSEQERRGRLRYGELVAGIDAVVWESSAIEPGFWYVSRRAEAILGYAVEEWYADPLFWERHVHPDDRDAIVDRTRRAAAAGEDHDLEYRMVAADGRTVWIRDLVRITVDEAGTPTHAKGVMLDITAHKDAESRVRLYVDIVERIPVALFLFRLEDALDDGSFRLLAVNPAGAALVDSAPEQLVGQRLDRVLPDMAAALSSVLAEVARSGRGHSADSYSFKDHRTGAGVFALDAFPLPDSCVGVSFDDVTARSAIEDALRHQAQHDALTGLPNRGLLIDRLQRALAESHRRGNQVSLLVMDLDQFKEVNDTLGHPHGDRLLELLGRRLLGVVRDSDTIARLGGDEFAVLLTASGGPDAAVAVANKIMAALQEPFVLDGLAIETHTSIGIAVSPDHGADVPTLMQRADVAMYEAKRSGSGYAVYTAEHDRHSVRRLTLSSELRRALDQDELILHYQPKLAIPSGDVIGVECLIRWNHPEHGMLAPEEFIGLAAVSGLIRPLTRWVIHEAARQCRDWADRGYDIAVALNISVRNLYDAGLVEYIRHVLDVHQLTADRLLLEITENEVMEDPVLAMEVLGRIGALGVALSIDDFGTGYSSLSYLKQLPIDEIKIDQSFVAGLATSDHDQVIVRSIIDLGHNLGRIVTAEGVEDVATWNHLIELGCDRAQGYLLGRPMTADKIVEWMTISHPTSSFLTTPADGGASRTTAVGRSS